MPTTKSYPRAPITAHPAFSYRSTGEELSRTSLRVSSTCELLCHFKSKHSVPKPELQLKSEMSHKEIYFKLVSVEASRDVAFVAIEVEVGGL
jgi:hypothetical protein